MASVQCKMCGYMVDLQEGATVGECPACGSVTTFPKLSSEHAEQLYARAEHYRQANDFDKALGAYEAIVNENPEDAEAYWGMVLSRYGIEYVEDPLSHERVPTCHRVQYDSILADGDYKSALEHADGSSREIYETEAKRIAEIQKGILSISSQEKPFDVFICYKETTDGGSRTKDSVVAQDIYYQLTNAGYKVFFARITLEGKLGQQYEPYIFAALNSAKVMLVVGSKKEYFNAVWVRNEWSRYLALMKRDRSRLLIPCYKDMDAYDIPEELSMLQSQDMSKIGFIQDLLRGIGKVLGGDKKAGGAAAQSGQGGLAVAALLKRTAIFLETGDFQQAQEYCNKVLDKDPENAEAYLYLMLAKNRLTAVDELCRLPFEIDTLASFKLVMKFADSELKGRLQEQVNKQKQERRYQELQKRFREFCDQQQKQPQEHFSNLSTDGIKTIKLNKIEAYKKLMEELAALGDYRDAASLRQQCEEWVNAEMQQMNEGFQQLCEKAVSSMETATAEEWRKMADLFGFYSGFVSEADDMVKQCLENSCIVMYGRAQDCMADKNYDEAIELFSALGEYADSKERLLQCMYENALECKQVKNYAEAIELFMELGEYADSKELILQCQYEKALECRKAKKHALAIQLFKGIEGYADSNEQLSQCQYEWASEYRNSYDYTLAILLFSELDGYGDSLQQIRVCRYLKYKKWGFWIGTVAICIIAFMIIKPIWEKHRIIAEYKDKADNLYDSRRWRELEKLGNELSQISQKEGKKAISRSKELRINEFKANAEAASEKGDWRELERLGKELSDLSPEEGKKLIGDANKLHIEVLEREAKQAEEDENRLKNEIWLELERIGKEICKLSPDKGNKYVLSSKIIHKQKLENDINDLDSNIIRGIKREIKKPDYLKDWVKMEMKAEEMEKKAEKKEKIAEEMEKIVEELDQLGYYKDEKELARNKKENDEKWVRNKKEEARKEQAEARKERINSLKGQADAAGEKGDLGKMEMLGMRLRIFSQEESDEILEQAKRIKVEKLIKEFDDANIKGDLEKMKEIAESQLSKSLPQKKQEDFKLMIKVAEIEANGKWEEMESLGNEIVKTLPEEGRKLIMRSMELHKKKLMAMADQAYRKLDWREMESLGNMLNELSIVDGKKVLSRMREGRDVKERWSKEANVIVLPGGNRLELIKVEKGIFKMGRPDSEEGPEGDEPLHEVCISKDFWLGKYEVTQEQYAAIMEENPVGYGKSKQMPVNNLDWNKAMQFCQKLTELARKAGYLVEGYEFTLPTEAQWEFAARGGNKSKNYRYSGGNIYNRIGTEYVETVGTKGANELGFHDMSGNVAEWCRDWYGPYPKRRVKDPLGPKTGTKRVCRFGKATNDKRRRSLPVGTRDSKDLEFHNQFVGFRVALSPIAR